MNGQDQGNEDSYFQASSSMPDLDPVNSDVTDYASQQMYTHQWYPPTPANPPGIYHTFTYVNNDYFTPASHLDGYSDQYLHPYPKQQEYDGIQQYSGPNFTYMPGIPIQTKSFESSDVRMLRELSIDNSSENQWQPDTTWNEREKIYPPFRGKRKNKFQSQNHHHKNFQGHIYSTNEQGGFYGRDDYYYETPTYQNSDMYMGRRGNVDIDLRGRRSHNYQSSQFRLGDGDGKPHRRKNNDPRWAGNDFFSGNRDALAVSKSSHRVHGVKDQYNRAHASQVYDLQTENSWSPHSEHGHKKYHNSQQKSEERQHTGIEIQPEDEKGESSIMSKEHVESEVSSVDPQADGKRQEVVNTRARSLGFGNSGKKGAGSVGHRSVDIKKFKPRIQEHDSAEIDESQRGTLSVWCIEIWYYILNYVVMPTQFGEKKKLLYPTDVAQGLV